METTRLQITISSKIVEELERTAKEMTVPKSTVITLALREYFAKQEWKKV